MAQADESLAEKLAALLEPLEWQKRLGVLHGFADYHIVFSTSFSFEDQAITHLLAAEKIPARLITLDTGRLFEETHKLHQKTRDHYGAAIETYYPDTRAVQQFVAAQGINGFYNSVENRKACCHIRKVEPLARALKGADIWISGLRREHSATRQKLRCAEWDAPTRTVKLYPLIDVESDALWDFIRAQNVPVNPMHEQGFPSIGCAPCTRAIAPGEPLRAGRWWWEQEESQECGLHFVDGKPVRGKSKDSHVKA